MGVLLAHQEKTAAAVQELCEAVRLNPDDPDNRVRLAECHAAGSAWSEAVASLQAARRLNPVSADICAHLGFCYANQGQWTNATIQLRNAEALDLENGNDLQMAALAYDALHETPLAVEHYEQFLATAQQQGLDPSFLSDFADRLKKLKASLSPVFLKVSEPKSYSEQSLREALRTRLSAEELAMIKLPLTSTPEMRRWAEQLTQGATNDLQRAQKLYEALTRHLDVGPGGSRTAQETFIDWEKPEASFRCQEYARLYVALARDLNLKAFFVMVERDYEDRPVFHACAGVLIDGQALLVDPSYRWFGVPHKQFVFEDDYRAVVDQLNQTHDLVQNRLAVKLQPDSALSQFNLALELMGHEQWDDARRVLQTALKLDSECFGAQVALGILDRHDGQLEVAVTRFRKASQLNPREGGIHFELAVALYDSKRFKEARDEFQICLKNQPEPDLVDDIRHAIAEINERIGAD